MIAEAGGVPILYRDEHFLAIDKPSGLLSQPNPNHEGGSILNRLVGMGIELKGGEDPGRQGLIHRLDRDTSGVLLVSLSQEAYEKFQGLFKTRTIHKTYHFPAFGRLKRMEFTRKDPLGRHPVKRTTRQVDPNGREAETHFKLLKMGLKNYSLWQAHPKTGRTHQIRVHAQEGGLTILGDPNYGIQNQVSKNKELNITHTMLHCKKLEFTHPITGEHHSIEADYPEDFKTCLEALQLLDESPVT